MCFMFSEVTQIRGAVMSLTAAASGFVVFLLSVPVIQGQDDCGVTYTSTEICAVKGSTVEIHCSYTYPSTIEDKTTMVEKKFWFTKVSNKEPVDLKIDRDYTDRVQYLFRDDNCTLRITDLRESDAAVYKFTFTTDQKGGSSTGSPGVTLSVTDLQVLVEGSSTWAELKCHSRCDVAGHTPYVWYNNGEKLEEETSSHSVSVNDDGSYSCAVKGHEDHRSPPVYSPKLPSVSVSPSAEIVEGSSVILTCSSDANPAAKYTWYKKNGNLRLLSEEPQLVLRSIQSSDSGQYYCTAENKLGRRTSNYIPINVKYAPKPVSVSPSGDVKEGNSVTLTCSSDANPAANYTWYKDGDPRPLSEGPQLVFSSIQSSDSGQYYCTAQNELGRRTSTPGSISINVKYAPKLSPVSVSPSAEIVEGSSVTLTCSSDANPAATYTWYKKNRNPGHPPSKQTWNIQSSRNQLKLVLRSIRSSDSGEYFCTAENTVGKASSQSIFINVKYAPKLPSVSARPSGDVEEGSSVTLTCSSDANPAANYTWHKKNGNGKPLSEERQLVLRSIQSSASGQYYCTADNRLGRRTSYITINVKYAPKLPSVSVSPSAEIVEGSSVTLTCSSDANPAGNYTWYKENQTLIQGPEGIYRFTSISSSDRGSYHCKSENQHGQISSSALFVNVQYAPKLPFVSVSPSAEIVEGSSVTLTCSSDANPAANYTWYKENEDSSKASGQIFTITDIRAEHSGNYYCEAQNSRGRHNSTIYLAAVAGSWILITVATVSAVVLAIILISVFLWIMKKRASKHPSGETLDTREQLQLAEQPNELHYATVRFSKNPAQPRRYVEAENVVYTVVKCDNASLASRSDQEAVEDPAALYSTVNKKRNL